MKKMILNPVNLGMTWTSYISSIEGVLRSSGLWNGETFQLMGMTGIGFHFIMHKTLCPSSVTVYDWANEHLVAMDRIGIQADVYSVMDIHLNSFPKMQQDAIEKIRQSIIEGKAVVVWAPTDLLEFGVIYGYDDEDEVFYVQECTGKPCDPLLYSNLGKSEVPILFYQLIRGQVPIDPEKTFRDSLLFGVSEWEKTFHLNESYTSGRMAYETMIKAMEEGSFDDFGLAYNLSVYSDAKGCIAKYLAYVNNTSRNLNGLEKAIANYEQIAGNFIRLTELFPFSGINGSGCTLDRSHLLDGIALAKECMALEDEAIANIQSVLKA